MNSTPRTTYVELMGESVESACNLDPFKELELTERGRKELTAAAEQFLQDEVNAILQPHACYFQDGVIYTHADIVPMRPWEATKIRRAIRAIDFDPVYCKYGNPAPVPYRGRPRDVAS